MHSSSINQWIYNQCSKITWRLLKRTYTAEVSNSFTSRPKILSFHSSKGLKNNIEVGGEFCDAINYSPSQKDDAGSPRILIRLEQSQKDRVVPGHKN